MLKQEASALVRGPLIVAGPLSRGADIPSLDGVYSSTYTIPVTEMQTAFRNPVWGKLGEGCEGARIFSRLV